MRRTEWGTPLCEVGEGAGPYSSGISRTEGRHYYGKPSYFLFLEGRLYELRIVSIMNHKKTNAELVLVKGFGFFINTVHVFR